ncbi:MAG: Fur family transcriptional regulator [SAR324 cluster bacterium]|nr:Fur family transcriptional regulator [SAR324 cluster bacterium]
MEFARQAKGRHNHKSCIAQALASADQVCRSDGARLTDLRRKVLEIVWRGHDAVKAYDILERLGGERRSAKPPTVYRTLRFLLEQGLVHRLESLNAFVGCPTPAGRHESQFLICERCGWVREFHAAKLDQAIARQAKAAGFQVHKKTIEVFGLCTHCQTGRRAT